MAHIFISYSRQDKKYALQLADQLQTHGFEVWIDQNKLSPAERWVHGLSNAVKSCAAFILVKSSNADKSEWVQREVTLAVVSHKPLFPVWLEGDHYIAPADDPGDAPEYEVYLAGVQYEDVRKSGLPSSAFYKRLAEVAPIGEASRVDGKRISQEVNRGLSSQIKYLSDLRNKIQDDLDQQIQILTSLNDRIQGEIQSQRKGIELAASRLAETPRHYFKQNALLLQNFATDYDAYIAERHATNDPELPDETITPRLIYIRGIAAFFRNEFELIEECLNLVISREREKDEDQYSYDKRLANASYYLGVYHSNLGKMVDAIRNLRLALDYDPEGTDFLTQLVTAEVLTFDNRFSQAETILSKVETDVNRYKRSDDGKYLKISHQRRFLSRSYLIRSNIAIMAGNVSEATRYAQQANDVILFEDYYYSQFTLAQLLYVSKQEDKARKLFQDAYSQLLASRDLNIVTETRSRILSLMVAALCGKHGTEDDNRTVEIYLETAESLLDELPKIRKDNKELVVTVFSPLSKRNEQRETIQEHIDFIRQGKVVLVG